MLRKSRERLAIRFLRRTVLFLTIFSLGLLLFYVFGNIQAFLDDTQSIILTVLSASTLTAAMLSALLILVEITFSIIRKNLSHFPRVLAGLFYLAFSLSLSVTAHVIVMLSTGF